MVYTACSSRIWQSRCALSHVAQGPGHKHVDMSCVERAVVCSMYAHLCLVYWVAFQAPAVKLRVS